jgi:hypothetical protein
MSDVIARRLLPPTNREQIYFQLNPCNYQRQDNCPSAAEALYRYLTWGGGIQPAYCPEPGQGFIVHANFHRAAGRNATQQLRAIIEMLRHEAPGRNVVLHGIRPPLTMQRQQNARDASRGRAPRLVLAPDHYGSLVRLGPPEDDVFYADCSRPDERMFYPTRSQTPPGEWPMTIENFLLHESQRFVRFEYTFGPYSTTPGPSRTPAVRLEVP